MFRVLSIRQKLLLVITGLLLLSGALSLVLHLKENRRAQEQVQRAVDRIVENLTHEGLVGSSGSPLGSGTAFEEEFGRGVVRRPRSVDQVDITTELVRPLMVYHGGRWNLVVTKLSVRERLLDDESFDLDRLREGSFLPLGQDGERGENLSRETIDRLPDPITAVQADSLPRELTIAGAVLLVGFVLTWFVAGRLTRPLKTLTRQMESVAQGDLSVDFPVVGRQTSAGQAAVKRGDELTQMGLAFNSMVESLREKREIERKVFQTERLAALGNLAAGVAHDVRNPLNTIGLNLSHLRDSYAPEASDDPEQQRRRAGFERSLDDIKEELDRLNELVVNFLALAIPGDGDGGDLSGDVDGRADLETCAPKDLVEDCLRLLRKEAESRGVVLEAELSEVPAIRGVPNQLRRAITNLLLNSLQALERSEKDERRLTLRLDCLPDAADGERAEVLLAIEDSGPGMNDEELERALLPYHTTRPEGTGLGLPIARGIIEAHRGRLELSSRPGEGTRVQIALPVQGEVSKAQPEEVAS